MALVPPAPPLPAWSLPLRVLSPWVWLLLVGAAAAYALAWHVVAGEPPGASVTAALRAFSPCGGSPRDRVRATPQRLQMAAALLASAVVVVVAVYQGHLLGLITNPQYESEIETFEQLTKAKITLLLSDSKVHLTIQKCSPQIPIRVYNTIQELRSLLRSKTKERYAVYYSSELWKTFRAAFFPEMMSFRETRDSFFLFHLHLCSRQNWPWSEMLKRFILQTEGNGLFRKWKENFNTTYGINLRTKTPDCKPQHSHEPRKAVALKDLVGHLLLLGAGLSASALAFCAELWRGRGAGWRLRERSRVVRAQLSSGWRRTWVVLRRVGALIGKFVKWVIATPSNPRT